jgi:hypothetical protein
MDKIIYTFWTGDNEMSKNRKDCIQQLKNTTGCKVELITKETLNSYILDHVPLHEAYNYLSETHKADYLRTYFMNFYGGGYSDIKQTTGSWIKAFNDLEESDNIWMNGFRLSGENDVSYEEHSIYWESLIGQSSYISKPQTPLTIEWYSEMISLLDKKIIGLRKNPAKFPQDHSGRGFGLKYREGFSKYPIGWNEMLGHIFDRISYKYKDKLLQTVPTPICVNYR